MIAKDLEKEVLLNIQRQHPRDELILPGYEDIGYEIDLSTRTIKSPEFLSVEKDHDSEIKYFVIDRYLDHKDLSTTFCIIQYRNAKGEELIYPVPFFDTFTLRHKNKMILPWNISGSASAAAGEIIYSFRFYEFETHIDANNNIAYGDLIYNLNTLPAKSKILHGLEINLEQNDKVVDYKTDAYNYLLGLIQNNDRDKMIYWNIYE